jgi:hypothetical protein
MIPAGVPTPPPVDPISIGLNILKYGPTIKKGWDWLTGKKGDKAKRTISPLEQQYTNFLQGQAKTGMGQPAMNMMMGQTSRAINPMINQMQAGNTGTAIAQGIEGSGVVGQQNLQVGALGVGQMAQTARDIAMKNITIKNQAQTKLGTIGMDRTDKNYQVALDNYNRKSSAGDEFLGGVADWAAGKIGGSQMVSAKNDALKKYFPDMTPEEIAKLIKELG